MNANQDQCDHRSNNAIEKKTKRKYFQNKNHNIKSKRKIQNHTLYTLKMINIHFHLFSRKTKKIKEMA